MTYLVTVPTVALIALLIGVSLRPAADGSGPTGPLASPIAQATAGPTPFPSPLRPPGPNEYPEDFQDGPCTLPDALPQPGDPVGAPVVHADGVAMLFGSHLYVRKENGRLHAQDSTFTGFEVGLWFAPAGTRGPARLVAETKIGAVIPLAMSPAADMAAVWWLPDRRENRDDDCIGGIYLVSLASGESRLLASGEWWVGGADAPEGNVNVSAHVAGRPHILPATSFSSDGRFVALVEASKITIHDVALGRVRASHVGTCDASAWSSTGATFVAGCEDMTSAWVVQPRRDRSDRERSVPLPSPVEPSSRRALEELPGTATIGVTRRGDIRVVRFYGHPPGCDSPGCAGPGPAYTVTTVDLETAVSSSTVTETEFFIGATATLFPESRSVYVGGYQEPTAWNAGPRSAVIRIADGDAAVVRRFGRLIGTPPGATALFGRRVDRAAEQVIATTLSRTGIVRVIGTIEWAADVQLPRSAYVIPVWGLVVDEPA